MGVNYRKRKLHEWIVFASEMACIFLLLYIVRHAFLGWAVVHGGSMNPTVYDKDVVLFSKHKKTWEYGDIVVCHSGKGLEEELIKRVIGVPGDVIQIDKKNHQVLVNGVMIEESYISEETIERGDIHYPARVPPGQYFVMGDNRNKSLDSRFSEVGTLPAENIQGKVHIRIFPLNKIKWFE